MSKYGNSCIVRILSVALTPDSSRLPSLALCQVIVAAATGGLAAGSLGQPVIIGYLVAGSVVGPGGFGIIEELVQVRERERERERERQTQRQRETRQTESRPSLLHPSGAIRPGTLLLLSASASLTCWSDE